MDAIEFRRYRSSREQHSGFSMIEVLVSLVIVVLGVLGLISLQAHATLAGFESYQRAQALVLMNDMVDRINQNRGSAQCYQITDPTTGQKFLGTTAASGHLDVYTCAAGFLDSSTKARAEADLQAWDLLLQGAGEKVGSSAGTSTGAMIGARGCISYDTANGTYTVTVTWQGDANTFAPTDKCAQNLYGSETQRRAVSTTFRIAKLSG